MRERVSEGVKEREGGKENGGTQQQYWHNIEYTESVRVSDYLY